MKNKSLQNPITPDSPEWELAFNNWRNGKNPTDSKEWLHMLSCTNLKVASVKIVNKDDEYICKAYDQHGKRWQEADYFTKMPSNED